MSYQGVALPYELLQQVDEAKDGLGYTSRTDFIKQAIRREIERVIKVKRLK